MNTVWVIEQGSYSDYRVVGIFTTKQNAELIAEKINTAEDSYDKASVAEWPLDPAVGAINDGLSQWLVHMRRDGNTEHVGPRDFAAYEIAGSINLWERTKAEFYKGKSVVDILVCVVWAKDEQHAVKIANEHRTRMIANGEWK